MIITLIPQQNKSILELLQDMGIGLDASCGGTGRCGSCAIKLLEGQIPVTDREREFFSEREIEKGIRLACRAYPMTKVKIEIPEKAIIATGSSDCNVINDTEKKIDETKDNVKKLNEINITIDLGTTTVAICFYDNCGQLLDTRSFLNPQRSFGADVISRIKAATEGRSHRLAASIRNAITNCIINGYKSLSQCVNNELHISRILLAGNTAMIHLLAEWDCRGLTMYPFTPVSLDFVRVNADALFSDRKKATDFRSDNSSSENTDDNIFKNVPLIIFPGISAFVGGDILSGMFGLGFEEKTSSSDRYLLLDLGTNGEMVYMDWDGITASSTAAGPAFEAGNISCGMGFVPGAVDHITSDRTGDTIHPGYHVIGEGSPEGLCGSGLLELVNFLLENGILRPEGDFANGSDSYAFAYSEAGEVLCLTQTDIRELQLAKAAIRAGIEIITQKQGYTGSESVHVFLAGGLGNGIAPEKIQHIGLLPQNCSIEPIGNSCLKGLEKYLSLILKGKQENADSAIIRLKEAVKSIDLSCEDNFNTLFINFLKFQ